MKYYYHPNMSAGGPTPAGQVPQAPSSQPWQGQPAPGGQVSSQMPFSGAYAQREREQAAKKEIRRDANGLGAGLLFVQAIGTVLVLLIPGLLNLFFPGASQNGGIYYDALEYAIYAPVSIILSLWLGMKIAKRSLPELVPFGKVQPRLWFGCTLFAFLFVFVDNIAGDLASMISPYTVTNMEAALGTDPETPFELVLSILHMAAVPALVEELAFRGIALGMLRRYGDIFAIVVSALLFGMLHGNLIQIPFAFFVGVILAYTVVRTGSIVPAVIIHFINNAMSCLLSYYTVNVSPERELWFSLFVYGAWLFLGLLGFSILKLCFGEKLTACCTPYQGCLSPKQRKGAFFSGAALIVALAVYGFSAVLFALPLPGM
ncbi:MAG: CPBP family intramembrane metalloprotease, partial [Clostridia bacterium]|nr:CPBP family intramembrane metalloprotease [Clostridia bacterium]